MCENILNFLQHRITDSSRLNEDSILAHNKNFYQPYYRRSFSIRSVFNNNSQKNVLLTREKFIKSCQNKTIIKLKHLILFGGRSDYFVPYSTLWLAYVIAHRWLLSGFCRYRNEFGMIRWMLSPVVVCWLINTCIDVILLITQVLNFTEMFVYRKRANEQQVQ
uniref:Uncharacterized protein n=1 Tax=Glossina brevipalpis TaxID=37001 RepID=A0A1A9WPH6_9MUSC